MKLFGNNEVNDTDAETERVMTRLWRNAPSWRKLQQVSALNKMVDSLVRVGVLQKNPHADESAIRSEIARRKLPPHLYALAHANMKGDGVIDFLSVLTDVAATMEMAQARYVFVGSVASSRHGDPRTTNDIDVLTDLQLPQIARFIEVLGDDYYFNRAASIRKAIDNHRSFNLIHLASMIKIDVFCPAPNSIGWQTLERRQSQFTSTHEEHFVASPEDTIIAKLDWFRKGGEVSERQWTDVLGIIKMQDDILDFDYLREWAARLRVDDLLERVLREARVT